MHEFSQDCGKWFNKYKVLSTMGARGVFLNNGLSPSDNAWFLIGYVGNDQRYCGYIVSDGEVYAYVTGCVEFHYGYLDIDSQIIHPRLRIVDALLEPPLNQDCKRMINEAIGKYLKE